MKMALWLGSFVYLSAISAWIVSAVKEEDDGPETRSRALRFFGFVIGGTIGFCVVIFAIEKLL